ncbi:MAG: hypothetical protein P8013_12670 [Candidatus Sulfobium sp.]|jgi:hypothetical protein
MQRIRYLLSNVNIINILLAGGVVAVAYFTFFPGQPAKVTYRKPVAQKTAVDQKPAAAKKGLQDEKNPFPTDYMVIADQNLFHPDRKIPEQKDQTKQADALPEPDFVLDGTLITDQLKMAFMEDKKSPVNTPGRPNRQTALKIGDSLSGFTLTEIERDKVVMQRGEEKMVVALEDPEKAKTRHYSQKTPAPPNGVRNPLPHPNTRGSTAVPARRSRPSATVRQEAPKPVPAPTARQNARKKFFNLFRSRGR